MDKPRQTILRRLEICPFERCRAPGFICLMKTRNCQGGGKGGMQPACANGWRMRCLITAAPQPALPLLQESELHRDRGCKGVVGRIPAWPSSRRAAAPGWQPRTNQADTVPRGRWN